MKYVLARSANPIEPAMVHAAVAAATAPVAEVHYRPMSAPLDCFNNVASRTATQGGDAIRGWSRLNLKHAIRKLRRPGMRELMNADQLKGIRGTELEAHCVWRNTDGALIDITPTDGGSNCSFIRDDSVRFGHSLHVLVFAQSIHRSRYRQFMEQLPQVNPSKQRFQEFEIRG